MQLQDGRRIHGRDRTFHGAGRGRRLAGAERQQQALPRLQDGADSHGDDVVRHLGGAVEEARIGPARFRRERLDARPRSQRGGRFVEPNMAVGPDAQHLQIDAAGRANLLLVAPAELRDVPGQAVGNMHILFLNIDVAEKVFPHEAVVGRPVFRRQAHILIQVERRHAPPVEVQLDQLAVQEQRRAARGQAQHGVRLPAQQARHEARGNPAGSGGGGLDDNFHGQRPRRCCSFAATSALNASMKPVT